MALPTRAVLASVLMLGLAAARPALSGDAPAAGQAGAGRLEPPGVATDLLAPDLGSYDNLGELDAWEGALPPGADGRLLDDFADGSDADIEEPIVVPEPSALVLIGGLAALLAAMTYLRWHFDQASTAQASTAQALTAQASATQLAETPVSE